MFHQIEKTWGNIFSNFHNIMGISSSNWIIRSTMMVKEKYLWKSETIQITEHNWHNSLHENMTVMTLQSYDSAFEWIDTLSNVWCYPLENLSLFNQSHTSSTSLLTKLYVFGMYIFPPSDISDNSLQEQHICPR